MRWSFPGAAGARSPYPRMNPFQVIRLVRHLPNLIKLVWRLFIDRRVGILPRLILLLAVAYIVSPIDLLPGAIAPIIGGADDLIVGYLGARGFIALCPKWVVNEHVRRIDAGG